MTGFVFYGNPKDVSREQGQFSSSAIEQHLFFNLSFLLLLNYRDWAF